MNRNYGKIIRDGAAIEYAPEFFAPNPAKPTAADYAAHGFLEIAVETPLPPSGKRVSATRYEAVDGRICAFYEYEDIPAETKTYSKLKLIVAAKAAGKWAAFKEFIASAGLEDEWSACQYLSNDYPQFAQAVEAVIAADIATREEIAAILEASEDAEV